MLYICTEYTLKKNYLSCFWILYTDLILSTLFNHLCKAKERLYLQAIQSGLYLQHDMKDISSTVVLLNFQESPGQSFCWDWPFWAFTYVDVKLNYIWSVKRHLYADTINIFKTSFLTILFLKAFEKTLNTLILSVKSCWFERQNKFLLSLTLLFLFPQLS